MFPPVYHHHDFVATHALEHMMSGFIYIPCIRYIYTYIYIYIHIYTVIYVYIIYVYIYAYIHILTYVLYVI